MQNHNIEADIKNTTHIDKIPFSSLLICFFFPVFCLLIVLMKILYLEAMKKACA